MIVFLQGIVFTSGLNYIDVDVQGVGYRVSVTERFALQVDKGQSIFVYTHQHVREDAVQLFGFPTELDRALFELLISVSGVGPKSALQVVNDTTAQDFTYAIRSEDLNTLCKLPGVGKKTAQRLIVELKDKLDGVWFPDMSKVAGPQPERVQSVAGTIQADVVEALKMLGYSDKLAVETANLVLAGAPDLTIEAAIKLCLQELYQQTSNRR